MFVFFIPAWIAIAFFLFLGVDAIARVISRKWDESEQELRMKTLLLYNELDKYPYVQQATLLNNSDKSYLPLFERACRVYDESWDRYYEVMSLVEHGRRVKQLRKRVKLRRFFHPSK